MIELRWMGSELQIRQSIGIDAAGALCPGVPGEWETVPGMKPPASEMQAIEERDAAEDAADRLASLILGEPIDWPDHQDAWRRADEKAASQHSESGRGG